MTVLLQSIEALRRRLGVVVVFFCAFFAVAVVAAYLKHADYDSVAKILVNFEGRGISLSRADVQYDSTQLQAVEAVTSQGEILRSHELIARVVDELGEETFNGPPPSSGVLRLVSGAVHGVTAALDAVLVGARLVEPMDPRDALVDRVERALQVLPVRQTNLIAVSFRWRNPRVPPLVLDKLIALYQTKVAALNDLSDGYGVFVAQSQRASQDLDKAEHALSALALTYHVVDLKREKAFLLDRIEKLAPVASAAQSGNAADAPRLVLDGNVGGADQDALIAGGQVAQLSAQLDGLRIDRARLLASYTGESREVSKIDAQIAAVEMTLRRQAGVVVETLRTYRERLTTLQRVESDFDHASRNVDMATDAYQTYRKAAEDRRVMTAQEAKVRTQVVDPPTMPIAPVGPSRLMLVLAALVGAAALSVAAGLVFDWAMRQRAPAPANDEDVVGVPRPHPAMASNGSVRRPW